VVSDANPKITKPSTDELAIGIQPLSAGKFVADGNDFSFHDLQS